ncbi:MAG TPA: carbohydrate ABC transporter permease [Acidimicrobiales bacterium]|nr:carbohydrate ABC transporter permease [Acidimicrobiales bacterium]
MESKTVPRPAGRPLTVEETGKTAETTRHARVAWYRRGRWPAGRLLALLVLVAAALFFLIPVVWVLFATTKTDHAIEAQAPLSFGSFAQIAHTWDNLYSFEHGAILLWMRNSAIYSASGVLLALLVGIPAGYALAVTQFLGRKTMLTVTLVVMLVPANALVLPLFLGMSDVHLIGNAFSVILPFGFFPFGVYLAYIYFGSTIPADLLAAARVDGCSEWATFRRVALPLSLPVVGLVAFFNFVANWNNFFLPFVMLPATNQFPSSVGLEGLLAASPAFNPSAGVDISVLRPEVALAIVITVAPVLIVFMFAQRLLVRGLLAGATKE